MAAALRAALDGVPAPEAAPLRLRPGIALTLSPGGCDYVGAVARVSRELSHSPRSMGLRYWAGRAGASLRHRLGRAPQRG